MEFLTPKQKKEKARHLFIGYGLFAVLISLATYVLISTALGYELFSTKGQVIQNGLLFIDSKPSGADIYVNGKKESSKTDAKLSLPEGVYNVSIRKTGYDEWRDTVKLHGGEVKFVNYPRLLPTKPVSLADIPFQTGASQVLQSNDKRWLAVGLPETAKFAEVYDLNNPNAPPLPLSIPDVITDGQKIKLVEFIDWAGDNHHLLVKAAANDKVLYLLFDTEDLSTVVDLTDMFSIVATDSVGFWDSKWDKIVLHHLDGIVQLGSIKDKAVDATPLVPEKVIDFFALSGERALYTIEQNNDSLSLKFLVGAKSYIFSSLPKSQNPLHVESASFNRNEYIIMSGGSLEKTLLYRNLSSLVKTSEDARVAPYVLLPIRSTNVQFSIKNRFVLGTDGFNNVVYDLEAKESYKYQNPAKTPATSGWFDDSRLYSLGNDKSLSIYDFNGSNFTLLAPLEVGVPYVNADITRASFFVPSSNLQSLKFIDIDTPTATSQVK